MSFLNKFRSKQAAGEPEAAPAHDAAADPEIQPVSETTNVGEKGAIVGTVDENGDLKEDKELPDLDMQFGVQKVEAVTLSWTRTSLACLLVFVWIIFLTQGMRLSILWGLIPYVTSDFQSHSLLATISIVSDSLTAAIYIPMAKVLNVWGRAEGFAMMVCFATLGLILMAVSQNLATFCAAQLFYAVGFSGIIYTICVLAADVTNLRNRGLAFAFTSSPYMITAFAGPKAAEGFLFNVNWRWGFGSFAIILPVVSAPVFGILMKYQLRAVKEGVLLREKSGRTLLQNIWHYIIEFDLLGVILFAGGLTTFLLPFTLARSAPDGWDTPYIIGMIVCGIVTLALFGLQQTYLAPAPFMKHTYLFDRTVIAACLIDFTYQMSYYCWNLYFQSFLQVVFNVTVSQAGMINSTFQVVSGVLLFIVGYAIRRTGYFKWLFWCAVPIYIFALGLMIHFRQPGQSVGFIIMCEIFISIGGAIFILCMQLAVLAAVDHQHFASALAVLFVSGTLGSAVGGTVSGAIWTNVFPDALYRYMPESAHADIPTLIGNLPAQLAYAVGTPERLGVQKAYGYAQTRMLAAGVGVMGLGFLWTAMMRNINVKKMSQTKGVVF